MCEIKWGTVQFTACHNTLRIPITKLIIIIIIIIIIVVENCVICTINSNYRTAATLFNRGMVCFTNISVNTLHKDDDDDDDDMAVEGRSESRN